MQKMKKMKWTGYSLPCKAVLLLAVLCTRSPVLAYDMAFPGADWDEGTPESVGVDSAKLSAAVSFLGNHTGSDGTRELVIIRYGVMIWKGNNIDKVHGIWSGTKSFTSTVLGLLADDGLATLDTLAKDHLPVMAAHYPEVTLEHFTTMTSGYRAQNDEPTSSGYAHGPSQTWFDPDSPLFSPPGSQYAYWDSAMNQFANVLAHIAGEPIEDLFRRRIADPIGMNPDQWDWGDWGTIDGVVVNGGSGNHNRQMSISARQMARFGHIFLNRGNWDGAQLISASWVDAATVNHIPTNMPCVCIGDIDGLGVYGYNWWVNGLRPDGSREWPGAPVETYAASGYNNNKMLVIPPWSMVIVRLGLDGDEGGIGSRNWGTFLSMVGDAIITDPPVIISPAAGMDLEEGSTVTLEGTGTGVLTWRYDANSDGLGRVDIGTGPSMPFTVPTNVNDPGTLDLFLADDNLEVSQTHNILDAPVPPDGGDGATDGGEDGGSLDDAGDAGLPDGGAADEGPPSTLGGSCGCAHSQAAPIGLAFGLLGLATLRFSGRRR